MDASQAEATAGCEVTVAVLPNKDAIVAVTSCHPIHQSQFEAVLDMAIDGAKLVYQKLLAEVFSYLQKRHAIMSHK